MEHEAFLWRYIYSDKKLLQAVAVLQWGHNLLLINKTLSDEETFYYATESVLKNWNRDLLLNAIKMDFYSLHKNELRDNNFSKTLPSVQAEQANAILKDSYNLGFLGITEPVAELELEKRIIEKSKYSCLNWAEVLHISEINTGLNLTGKNILLICYFPIGS